MPIKGLYLLLFCTHNVITIQYIQTSIVSFSTSLGWRVMFQTIKLLARWLQLDIYYTMQLRVSLTCETHLLFQTKTETYKLSFVSGGRGIDVCVVIVYRLHSTKKNGLNTADFVEVFSEFVNSLGINNKYILVVSDFNMHCDY